MLYAARQIESQLRRLGKTRDEIIEIDFAMAEDERSIVVMAGTYGVTLTAGFDWPLRFPFDGEVCRQDFLNDTHGAV